MDVTGGQPVANVAGQGTLVYQTTDWALDVGHVSHANAQSGVPIDPGPPPSYFERLDFMAAHVRRLCDLRGERWGCIQFRKVANWYCKVLKPGREVQQTLVMLDSLATFDGIVARLREQGPPPGWQAGAAPSIPVPKGPIDKW